MALRQRADTALTAGRKANALGTNYRCFSPTGRRRRRAARPERRRRTTPEYGGIDESVMLRFTAQHVPYTMAGRDMRQTLEATCFVPGDGDFRPSTVHALAVLGLLEGSAKRQILPSVCGCTPLKLGCSQPGLGSGKSSDVSTAECPAPGWLSSACLPKLSI
eukprot:scaffold13882_cov31-Tisochrysis_lutea.AAC.1